MGDAQSVHVRVRAAALQMLGYRVTLITPRKGEVVACPQVSPEDCLVSAGLWGKLGTRLAKLRAVHTIFARYRGDATHIHFAQGLWAGLGMLFGAKPLIVTVMGGDVLFREQGRSSWADRMLTRLMLRSAELVTAKSEHLASVIRSLGVHNDRILVMYWGVDRQHFKPSQGGEMRRALGLAPDSFVLLSSRFLQPLYNVDKIVEAFPLILRRVGHAQLLILDCQAEPNYRMAIIRRISELRLEGKVRIVPPVPHERMPEIYAASDVVIGVPSSDGMPMTVLEAMACGKPNVVSDLPHYQELLTNGKNVLVCPPLSASIAEAVCQLASEPELQARLVENGFRTVEQRADLAKDLVRLDERLTPLLDGRPRMQPIHVRLQVAALLALAALTQRPGPSL
ncbi:glycosyltransferase family 4 protein [Nitrospira sp. NS4]|uniref:glycosyltransferase family 4 protein n=1 Tax=Nitrospira sp. NS4 TaxID=3414498 RepID=UPI003C302A37